MAKKDNKIILEKGDVLNLTISAIANKKTLIEELCVENVKITLGKDELYKGFDKWLIGTEYNDHFDLVIPLPKHLEPYYDDIKEVKLSITINSYKEASVVKLEEENKKLKKSASEFKKEKENYEKLIEGLKFENMESTRTIDALQEEIDKTKTTIKKLKKEKSDINKAAKSEAKNSTGSKGDSQKTEKKNSKLNSKIIKEYEKEINSLRGLLHDNHFVIEELKFNNQKLMNEIKAKDEAPKALVVPKEMKQEIEKYALQKFFEDFVSYYKYFKLSTLKANDDATKSKDKKLQSFASGNMMISRQFDDLLQKYGLVELQPTLGQEFDPSYQKVNELIYDKKAAPNTIVKVHSPGYKLHDRVITVAIVDVSTQNKK
ncbi:nucleotide exchange factor GrpE [Mycoplasmopsis adleri]|uniref:nucleotide exchange factor GrpE n=1 Tax=Mycoplasmopsis adleri TaxID=51362 RepID=UPI003873276D